ncbi:MAG: Ppx/GppA phosphatase family protein [Mariprofundaceae bacterium]|nr:Ppx/GppA phosphatase family protein [Mariprofundaceae bacterium]
MWNNSGDCWQKKETTTTETSASGPILAAAIDVGSNAMRLHIAGPDAEAGLKTIHYHRESVRLGHDAFTRGRLSEETMEKALQAFEIFRSMIDLHPVQTIRAVGTSALRDSVNASELIRRIKDKTGIEIEIISGEEEARLIHLSVHHRVPDMDKMRTLLIDIGGGSIEITLAKHGDIVALESFSMGTVRLLELFRDASGNAEKPKIMNEYIASMQQKVREEMAGMRIDFCIGTGGNIEALDELGVSLLGNDSNHQLSYKDIRKLLKHLQSMSYEDRIDQIGLRPDRADVIIPAAIALKSIVKLARPAALLIPSAGLADGVLLDLLQEQNTGSKVLAHQAIAWARSMARKYHADVSHARHVRILARKLFSQLKDIHQLNDRDLLLLQVSAIVHEIGITVRPNKHHRHAFYLINASPMVGLSSSEKKLVALVVRYHRKRTPDTDNEPFSELTKAQQKRVFRLNVLLRLAIALDKERRGNVRAIHISRSGKISRLQVEGKGDLLLERWAVRKEAPWFETVFDHRLEIA